MKHGHTRNGSPSRTWKSWEAMRGRCQRPTDQAYDRYGGRGISVCERWDDFANFLADMGERPPGKTLDRIDVNGNYEPGNCRWATRAEQGDNRRDTVRLTVGGVTRTLVEWSRCTGIKRTTIRRRMEKGWPPERCLAPPRKPLALTVGGVTRTMKEWARLTGVPYATIHKRSRDGHPPEACVDPDYVNPSILSPETREEIRRRARSGESTGDLGREFGVSYKHVWALREGKA